MIRRLLFSSCVLFLAFTAWVTTVVAPAMASPVSPGLVLSADGRTWSDQLAAPLFSPDVIWVPGDVRRASLFVANHGPTSAAVRVRLQTTYDDLVDPGDVVLEARLLGERWQPLDRLEGAAVLNKLVALPTDDARRIDLRATFRPQSTNRSQSAAVNLAFVVELSQALAPTPADEELPGTGAPRLWLPGLVGLSFLVLGAVLLRRESRRIEAHDG